MELGFFKVVVIRHGQEEDTSSNFIFRGQHTIDGVRGKDEASLCSIPSSPYSKVLDYFVCFKKEPRVAEIGVEKGKRKKYEEKGGELEGTETLEGDTKREEKETTRIRKRRKRGER